MLIGAHVSVAGGYRNGLVYGQQIGAECIQIFAKSPRQWRGPAIDAQASAEFADACEDAGFGPVFTHTAYLLNLSTPDEELRAKSAAALADELVRAALLGAAGTVTHVGTDPDQSPLDAAARAGATIRDAFELAGERGQTARLLLENTAGGGATYGSSFTQLGAIVDDTGMPASRLGVCFDTCHGFAYGMPLDTADGWRDVIDEIAAHVGLDRLGLIHANDCMFERGSRRDRHAWIGDGFIGEAGFEAMVCAPELQHVAVVTEMPGDAPTKDEVNLARLKALRERCSPSH